MPARIARLLSLVLLTILAWGAPAGSALAARITSVVPAAASVDVTIRVTGSGFAAATADNVVTFTPAGAGAPVAGTVTAVSAPDATGVLRRLTVRVPQGLPVGAAAITVNNTVTGEIISGASVEIVSLALTPASMAAGTTGDLRISLNGNASFDATANRVTFGSGVTVNRVTVESGTSLVVNVTVAATAALGPRTLSVLTPVMTAVAPNALDVRDPNAPTNQAPTARIASPATVASGTPITFDGSASSDPDAGDVLTYEWRYDGQVVGTAATLTHTFTVSSETVVTVSLTVRDGRGGEDTATRQVTVTVGPPPTNQAPTAAFVFSPAAPLTTDAVMFDAGASSDPDGDALTYAWTFETLEPATGVVVTRTFPAAGAFTVTLTVDDGRGGVTTETKTVTVSPPPNRPPTATFTITPASPVAGEPVSFDASASSDPDGDAITFSWVFAEDAPVSGAQVSRVFAQPGTYRVRLTVTDSHGAFTEFARDVSVGAQPNRPPTANFTASTTSSLVDATVSFDASASTDPDGDPLSFAWSFGDGIDGAGAQVGHAFATPGTFTVTLTVSDGRGGSATASQTVTVWATPPANRPPTAVITGATRGTVGVAVSFDGRGSADPDNDPLTYAWDFGVAGSSASSSTPSFTYPEAGTFTVALTVSDPQGAPGTATRSIVIDPASDKTPPVITLTGPAQALPGTTVTFTASASDNVGVSVVRFTVDAGAPEDVAAAPYERQVTLPAVAAPDQQVVVKAAAFDAAGNSASALAAVTVSAVPDTTPPAVLLLAPPTSAPGSPVLLSARVSDDSGVAEVVFLAAGAQVGRASAPPFTATFTVAADAQPGTSVPLVARATDVAGNVAEDSATMSIVATADTTPPALSLDGPSQALPGERVTVTATATDDVGVVDVTFAVDAAALPAQTVEPFSLSYVVPPQEPAGSTVTVSATARDFSANHTEASKTIAIVAPQAVTRSVIAGEAYDDATGLPLAGVTVQLSGTDAQGLQYGEQATTDARGRYTIRATGGSGRLRLSKAGYTVVWREVTLPAGQAVAPLDARLTPAGPALAISGVSGGTLTSGAHALAVPAGVLGGAAQVTMTVMSGQGLRAPLPAGWSPLGALDIGPEAVSMAAPATWRAPDVFDVGAARPVIVARYDETIRAWRATGTATRNADGQYEAPVSRGGQHVLIVPDAAPVAPALPAAGTLVAGVAAPSLDDAAAGALAPSPAVLFYRPGVFSMMTSSVTPAAATSSGLVLRAAVGESYTYMSGDSVTTDPFWQDLVFYQVGAAAGGLAAVHVVSPSLTFDPIALRQGVISVALVASPPGVGLPLAGSDGGTVTGQNGTALVVPPGALAEQTPLTLDTFDASGLAGLLAPPGLSLAGAMQLGFEGTLQLPAALSIPQPAGLTDPSRALLVQVLEVGGRTRLVLRALARLSGGRLISDVTLGGAPTALEGVRTPGRYLFLQSDAPLGFAAGLVRGTANAPFAGALVTTTAFAVVSVSRGDGAYFAAARSGPTTFVAADVVRNDRGTGAATLPFNAVAPLDLTLAPQPPTVTAITPANGAVNVALSSAITVTFSKPIDVASITGANAGNVALAAGTSTVAATLALSSTGTELTVRPSAPMAADTHHTFALSANVTDLSGNRLGQPVAIAFDTLDTTPPPLPPAGSISASIPDNGLTTVAASQGTASPRDRVTIRNLATKQQQVALVNGDGSFSASIAAALSHKLQIVIRDQAGNEILVDVPVFRSVNPDGSVSQVIGAEGGRVEAGGAAVDVPADAFETATVVTVGFVTEAQFPYQLASWDRQNFSFTGGVRLDLGGVWPKAYLNMSIPAPPGVTVDDQWALTQAVELDGTTRLNVVDTARVIGGRVQTSSPPCPGVTGSGVFGFLRSARPLGVVYGIVPGSQTLPPGVLAPLFVPAPGVWLPSLNPVDSSAPVRTGADYLWNFESAFEPWTAMTQNALTALKGVCLPLATGNATITNARVTFDLAAASPQFLPSDRVLTIRNLTRGYTRRFESEVDASGAGRFPDLVSVEGAEADAYALVVEGAPGARTLALVPRATRYVRVTVPLSEFQVGDREFSVLNVTRNNKFASGLGSVQRAVVDPSVLLEGDAVDDQFAVEIVDQAGNRRVVANPVVTPYAVDPGNLVLNVRLGTIDPTQAEIAQANANLPPDQQITAPGVVRVVLSVDGASQTVVDVHGPGAARLNGGGLIYRFDHVPANRYELDIHYDDGKIAYLRIPTFKVQVSDPLTGASSLVTGPVPPPNQPFELPIQEASSTAPLPPTQPTVLNLDPASPVSFKLPEPVDPSTIGLATLEDNTGATVQGTWTLSADRLTATFTPESPLRPGEQYEVGLSALRTTSGKRLSTASLTVVVFRPWKMSSIQLDTSGPPGEPDAVQDVVMLDRPGAMSASIPYWVVASTANRNGFKAHVVDTSDPRAPEQRSRSGAGYRQARLANASDPRALYPVFVFHDVQLIPQTQAMSCWAASIAMIAGWRDQRYFSDADFAGGSPYALSVFKSNKGWERNDLALLDEVGFVAEPAQSYSVDKFRELLEKYGPLHVTAWMPGTHSRVVQGLIGDGTPEGTWVYIKDPWEKGMQAFRPANQGSDYVITYAQLMQEMEALAGRENAETLRRRAECGALRSPANACVLTPGSGTAACTQSCIDGFPTADQRLDCLVDRCLDGYQQQCGPQMAAAGCNLVESCPGCVFVAHLPTQLPPAPPPSERYVVAGAWNIDFSFISILDVTNPAALSQIGGKVLAANPERVVPYTQKGTVKAFGRLSGLATIPATTTSPPLGFVSVAEVGLFALDLTKSIDPKDPVTGVRRPPDPLQRQLEGFFSGDYSDVVTIAGNKVVALNGNYGAASSLDVFDPDLSLVSSFSLNDSGRRLAFKAGVPSDRNGDGTVGPGEHRDLLFVGGVQGITIVDATDPQSLALLGDVPMPGITYELAPLSTGKTLLAGGYYSRQLGEGDATYMVDVSDLERTGLLDRRPVDGRDDRILFTARYPEVSALRADNERGLAYVGTDKRTLDIWGLTGGTDKYKDQLELRPAIIPMPALPSTEQLSVWLTLGGSPTGVTTDVATDPQTQFDWLGGSSDGRVGLPLPGGGPGVPAIPGMPDVSSLLNTLIQQLSEKAGVTIPVQVIPASKVKVVNGILQVEEAGIQVLRARRGDTTSNFAVILAGFQLDGIDLEPVPELNLAGTMITKAFSLENPPFVLFPGSGQYNAFARIGQLQLTDMTFKYLGRGELRASALLDFVKPFAESGATKIVGKAFNLGARGAGLLATVLIHGAKRAAGVGLVQLLDDVKSADPNVATITSRTGSDAWFQGLVEAQNPGFTKVSGTLDLGRWGKGSDDVLVFSAPRLDAAMLERADGGAMFTPAGSPSPLPGIIPITRCTEPALVRTDGLFFLGGGTIELEAGTAGADVLKALNLVLPGGAASWPLFGKGGAQRVASDSPVRFYGDVAVDAAAKTLTLKDWIVRLPLPNVPASRILPPGLQWLSPYTLDYHLGDSTKVALGRGFPDLVFKQELKPASPAVKRGESTISSRAQIDLIGTRSTPASRVVIDCGDPRLDLSPPVVASVTCSGTRPLELVYDPVDGTPKQNVTADPNTTWEWGEAAVPASSDLMNTLEQIREDLSLALNLPSRIPIAAVSVGPGGVLTIAGCGVNLVRGRYQGLVSSYTLVIAGFALDEIDLVPTSRLTSGVTLPSLAAAALPGSRNAPLLLTAPQVSTIAGTPFVGDAGAISVENARFSFLGGPGRVDIRTFIQALRPALDRVLLMLAWDPTQGAEAMADVLRRLTDANPQASLNQVVSYQAMEPVVRVEPGTPNGRITSQAPGLTFVKGTMDLGPLGRADDAVLTWVLPQLQRATIRPHTSILTCNTDPAKGPLVRTFGEARLNASASLSLSLTAPDTDRTLKRAIPGGYTAGQGGVNLALTTGGVDFHLEFDLDALAPTCSTAGDTTSCTVGLADARVGFDVPTQAPGVQLSYAVADPAVAEVVPVTGTYFDARIVRRASSAAQTLYSADVAISGMGTARDPDAEILVECCGAGAPVCLVKRVTTGTSRIYRPGETVGFRVFAINATSTDQAVTISDDLLANGAPLGSTQSFPVSVAAGGVVSFPVTIPAPQMTGVLANHVYTSPGACVLGSPTCPWVWVEPPPAAGQLSRVTINEVVTVPVTDWNGDGAVTAADQWVEVSFSGPVALLDQWSLRFTDALGGTTTVPIGPTFPGTRDVFEALGLLVLNAPGPMAPLATLELLDPLGTVIDAMTVTGAPIGAADEAVARVPHTADTSSPNDFQRRPATKGSFNPVQ